MLFFCYFEFFFLFLVIFLYKSLSCHITYKNTLGRLVNNGQTAHNQMENKFTKLCIEICWLWYDRWYALILVDNNGTFSELLSLLDRWNFSLQTTCRTNKRRQNHHWIEIFGVCFGGEYSLTFGECIPRNQMNFMEAEHHSTEED
jgi:hypothetical protein